MKERRIERVSILKTKNQRTLPKIWSLSSTKHSKKQEAISQKLNHIQPHNITRQDLRDI